jgi:hypothetical protein
MTLRQSGAFCPTGLPFGKRPLVRIAQSRGWTSPHLQQSSMGSADTKKPSPRQPRIYGAERERAQLTGSRCALVLAIRSHAEVFDQHQIAAGLWAAQNEKERFAVR